MTNLFNSVTTMGHKKTQNEQTYPGAGIDAVKPGEVDRCLSEQYTRDLNNNPRNQSQIVWTTAKAKNNLRKLLISQ